MADLILYNANGITFDPNCPKARMIVVRDGKILTISPDNAPKQFAEEKTTVIDCMGKTVLPGFIDAHCHLRSLAESLITLRVQPDRGIGSIGDLQRIICESSLNLPPGAWIRARGYNEFYLAEKRHPTRWDLDRAAPAHPVKLSHRTGQAHILNSLALRLVGISRETPDPPGGLIDRQIPTGEPTGVLYRMGGYLSKKIPALEPAEIERGMKLANEELLSKGITSAHDATSHNGPEQWQDFERWKAKGLLKPRVTMMLGSKHLLDFSEGRLVTGLDKDRLRVGGVKVIIDQTTGSLLPDQKELNDLVLKIHRAGLQACLHAIEEDSVEAACSAIEYALAQHPVADRRHRIEHCSVCPPTLIARLAAAGITVVTQPSFLYYSGERYLQTVPVDQFRRLYPVASLVNRGVDVAAGSDCPVAPVNPLIGIYAACSRRAANGEPILPEERVSTTESLRMYTVNAARAGFEEPVKGTLSPGKVADLVVSSDDPTAVPVEEIKNIEVETTILGGEVVWEKGSNKG